MKNIKNNMQEMCSKCKNNTDCYYKSFNKTKRCIEMNIKYNHDMQMCSDVCCRYPICKQIFNKYMEFKNENTCN